MTYVKRIDVQEAKDRVRYCKGKDPEAFANNVLVILDKVPLREDKAQVLAEAFRHWSKQNEV